MKTYLVTGSASGMGAAVAQRLSGDGHRVIGLDLRDAQVCADLSTWEGRSRAVREVLTACGGVLDGAVLAAGMGPTAGRERTILEVNLLGVTGLLDGLRPALAAADKAKVVVFGSNSTTPASTIRRVVLRPRKYGASSMGKVAARSRSCDRRCAPPRSTVASRRRSWS